MSDSEIGLAPSVIKSVLPNAKFIAIMHDPTKRLFSQYWFRCHKSCAWKTKRDPVYAFLVLLFSACSIIYITAYAIINLFQLCIERGYSMFECVRRVTVVEHCKWLCTSESRKWNVLLPHCFLGECIFHVRAFCSSQLKNWCPVQTQRFKSVGISWSA